MLNFLEKIDAKKDDESVQQPEESCCTWKKVLAIALIIIGIALLATGIAAFAGQTIAPGRHPGALRHPA